MENNQQIQEGDIGNQEGGRPQYIVVLHRIHADLFDLPHQQLMQMLHFPPLEDRSRNLAAFAVVPSQTVPLSSFRCRPLRRFLVIHQGTAHSLLGFNSGNDMLLLDGTYHRWMVVLQAAMIQDPNRYDSFIALMLQWVPNSPDHAGLMVGPVDDPCFADFMNTYNVPDHHIHEFSL